jgi:hypothetical protein
MISVNVMNSLSQMTNAIQARRKKTLKVRPEKELEDYKLVEEYEGSCDECDREKQPPKCPICDGH